MQCISCIWLYGFMISNLTTYGVFGFVFFELSSRLLLFRAYTVCNIYIAVFTLSCCLILLHGNSVLHIVQYYRHEIHLINDVTMEFIVYYVNSWNRTVAYNINYILRKHVIYLHSCFVHARYVTHMPDRIIIVFPAYKGHWRELQAGIIKMMAIII